MESLDRSIQNLITAPCEYHRSLGTPWSNGLPCGCWRVLEPKLKQLENDIVRHHNATDGYDGSLENHGGDCDVCTILAEA